MKNKRAFQLSMSLIVVFAILSVTAFIVIGSFTNIWAKGTGNLKDSLDNTDYDGDGLYGILDSCPCDAEGTNGKNGCPDGMKIPKTKDEIKDASRCIDD